MCLREVSTFAELLIGPETWEDLRDLECWRLQGLEWRNMETLKTFIGFEPIGVEVREWQGERVEMEKVDSGLKWSIRVGS